MLFDFRIKKKMHEFILLKSFKSHYIPNQSLQLYYQLLPAYKNKIEILNSNKSKLNQKINLTSNYLILFSIKTCKTSPFQQDLNRFSSNCFYFILFYKHILFVYKHSKNIYIFYQVLFFSY